MEAPSIVHALPSQIVFNFLSQWHNKLCHFISDVFDYFLGWRKSISPTTRLAVNPYL